MLPQLKERILEVLTAVGPLACVGSVLQVVLVHAPAVSFVEFLMGSLLAAAGMLLLFIGIELGILPMGRFIGAELPKKGSLWLIAAVGFALGFATTVAEPDVLVLSQQVEAASQGAINMQTLVYIIGVGVGLFAAIGLLRVIWGFSMVYLLVAAYSIMIVLSFFSPAEFIPLAYDAGSVTTGVLTAPVVLALAQGLSSVLAGRSAMTDGFGLLGLASVGPIIVVLLLGMLLQ